MPNEVGPAAAVHEDPELFAEAINYTSATTGFSARLIEKDYFASVLLRYLCAQCRDLVFEGGTCLSKVYWDFARLSEDLDFALSLPPDAKRGLRRAATISLKQAVAGLPGALPFFRIVEPLRGFNVSTQYISVVSYPSRVVEEPETLKLEIGLREPLLIDACVRHVRTLLLDPISSEGMVSSFDVRAIADTEAYAEKARAALSRREPAIRDFYDFDYAIRTGRLDPTAGKFVALVRRKLEVPGNERIDLSEERREQLRRQVETELKPVLRPGDFEAFDFERAFSIAVALVERLGTRD